MMFRSFFVPLALVLTSLTNVSATWSDKCTDTSMDNQGYLYATCPTSNGALQKSWVPLGHWITNDNANLMWKEEGNFFFTCSSCNVSISVPGILNCTCRDNPGRGHGTTLQLDDHIYISPTGHLWSDFGQPYPSPYPTSQLSPPPPDRAFFVAWYADTTCSQSGGFTYGFLKPECERFRGNEGETINGIQFDIDSGFEAVIYEGEDCTGNVVWRTGINSTVHVCYKNLGTMGGRSVQVEPLWAPY